MNVKFCTIIGVIYMLGPISDLSKVLEVFSRKVISEDWYGGFWYIF